MSDLAGRRLVQVTTSDMSLVLLLGPQLRAFVQEGMEVVAVSAPGPWVGEMESWGIRHVPLKHATRSMAVGEDVMAFGELVRLFRRLRPDIVHTHNPKPGVYGRVAARLAGVPAVVNTVHGLLRNARRFGHPTGSRLRLGAGSVSVLASRIGAEHRGRGHSPAVTGPAAQAGAAGKRNRSRPLQGPVGRDQGRGPARSRFERRARRRRDGEPSGVAEGLSRSSSLRPRDLARDDAGGRDRGCRCPRSREIRRAESGGHGRGRRPGQRRLPW